jgi:hypothetical protein
MVKALLGFWVQVLRKEGVEGISVILLNTNPLIPIIKKLGFIERPERSSVYVYANPADPIYKNWIDGSSWYMTVGDRDV